MWKCTYIETSAKNNYNIEAVFQEILQLELVRPLKHYLSSHTKEYHLRNQAGMSLLLWNLCTTTTRT